MCAWSNESLDFNTLAANIAGSSGLSFIPQIIPFGKKFCSLSLFLIRTNILLSSFDTIHTQETIVKLSKWNELVNTIDPMTSRFEGWISVTGLPFNMWNKSFFDRIDNMFGGLINQHTKGFLPPYRGYNQSEDKNSG